MHWSGSDYGKLDKAARGFVVGQYLETSRMIACSNSGNVEARVETLPSEDVETALCSAEFGKRISDFATNSFAGPDLWRRRRFRATGRSGPTSWMID